MSDVAIQSTILLDSHGNKLPQNDRKCAFTLAEVLITLTILGIVAMLTVPNVINKNQERINKTRVKKAMAVYESALKVMVIENNLRSDGMVTSWASGVDNCGNTTRYFKKVSGDGCIFKTADGIWWNIEDILRPVIYLKKDGITEVNKNSITTKAKDYDDKSAFILVGSYDGSLGVFRVDDLAYETSNPIDYSDVFVSKLYDTIDIGNVEEPTISKKCLAKRASTCIINGNTFNLAILPNDLSYSYNNNDVCSYNDDTFNTNNMTCGATTSAKAGDYYILPVVSISIEEKQAAGDYQKAAIKKCALMGARLANAAELTLITGSYTNLMERKTYISSERRRKGVSQAYNISISFYGKNAAANSFDSDNMSYNALCLIP